MSAVKRVRVAPVDGPASPPRYTFTAYAENGEEVAVADGTYANHLDALAEAKKLWPDAEIDDVVIE